MIPHFASFKLLSEFEGDFNPSELRQQERLAPLSESEWSIEIQVKGEVISAQLLDFSPFGMGASLDWDERIESLLILGETYPLVCSFGTLKFPSKGKLANSRISDKDTTKKLRLGFALVSESSPTREKLEHRRSELRLTIDKHLSPMCIIEDEYVFAERMFMRVLDLSASGFALELPTPRVPFLPGQRRWLKVLIPFLGEFKTFVRIAYVKKTEQADGVPSVHMVGVTFLKSIVDISPVLADYVYYSHPEFDRKDLLAAGFSREEFAPWDFKIRPRAVLAEGGGLEESDLLQLKFEDEQGRIVAELSCALKANAIEICNFELKPEFRVRSLQWHRLGVVFARFLLVCSHLQMKEQLIVAPAAIADVSFVLGTKESQMSLPDGLVKNLSPLLIPELTSLFSRRIRLKDHSRSRLLRIAGDAASFLKGHFL